MFNNLLEISEIKDSYSLFTNKKWLKSDMSNFQTRWKKLKIYWKVENELSINDNTRIIQI